MQRCWLNGAEGDALHAVLCAAGFNIRGLLRAIATLGMAAVFMRLLAWLSGWSQGLLELREASGASPSNAELGQSWPLVLCPTEVN